MNTMYCPSASIDYIKEKTISIAKEYGISKMMLFGSYASGQATDESDVDLLIEKGKPMSLLLLSGLRQDFEDAIGIPVDLVTTDGMDKEFYKLIQGTEILLYEKG